MPGPGERAAQGERIIIFEHDPRWRLLFAEEAERIRRACGAAIVAIEHVGSTSVPGLAAKPIIDIMTGVSDLAAAHALIPAMERLGYESAGAHGVEGRLYFRRGAPRSHHVHMTEMGSAFWRKHLLFRDRLRADPEMAAEYAAMKRALAAQFGTDRDGYTDAKTGFIERCLVAAGWRD
ncbi:MAG: GrpB family protein [Thermoflexaceae bacterium]|nr:GrpB family protein [Thermoflexaceae bacterium]